MTRFARAKGSKSSNERVPEPPTSWATMKEQLLEKQAESNNTIKRKKFEEMRQANYDKFILENVQENVETKWAEFPKLNTERKKDTLSENCITKKSKNNTLNNVISLVENCKKDKTSKNCKQKFNKLTSNIETNTINNGNILTKKNETHSTENSADINNTIINEDSKKKKSNKKNKIFQFDSNNESKHTFDLVNSECTIKNKMLNEVNNSNNVETSNCSYRKPDKNTIQTDPNNLNENISLLKNKKKKSNQNCIGKLVQPNIPRTLNSDSITCHHNYEHKTSNEKNVEKMHVEGNVENENLVLKNKKKKSKQKNTKSVPNVNLKLNKKIKFDLSQNSTNTKMNEFNNENVEGSIRKNETEYDSEYICGENHDLYSNLTNMRLNKSKKKLNTNTNSCLSIKKLENCDLQDYNKNNTIKVHDKKRCHDKSVTELHDQGEKIYKRRKPEIGKTFIKIDDKEEEIVKFDGFPIKGSDANRLIDLKKQMISRGIPRNEVNRTMKFERRKAEKALARDRKKICFHCRKSGHILSDCPELTTNDIDTVGTGICYKCGSTEHTHSDCKSVKGQEFKFAECFICKEQGHIARQCPDNPKGLYPQGGGCRLCGDVTHLKRDCPQNLQTRKNDFTLKRFSSEINLESLGDEIHANVIEKKHKKAVKF